MGPQYEKQRKQYKSGDYDDEQLLQDIRKNEIVKRIDSNYTKLVNKAKAAFKKDNPNFSDEDIKKIDEQHRHEKYSKYDFFVLCNHNRGN